MGERLERQRHESPEPCGVGFRTAGRGLASEGGWGARGSLETPWWAAWAGQGREEDTESIPRLQRLA